MPEPSPFRRILDGITGKATNKTPNPIIPPLGLTLVHTLQGHPYTVYSLAWSPDGSRLASGSADLTVRLWDRASAHLLSTLEGHTDGVLNLAWSPNGSLLASASATYYSEQSTYINGEVRIWRTDTWEPVAVLTGLNSMGMVAWHPHQPLLATGGMREEEILIWQLDLTHLLKQAPATETVHYKNAKVVLVGESGVGKSGLGPGADEEAVRAYGVDAWETCLAAGYAGGEARG